MAPFALLKKQAETMFRLICCERKTLFRLKKQAQKVRIIIEENRANMWANFLAKSLTSC